MESVYREAFATHGLDRSATEVHAAVLETWHDIAARRARGEERWAIAGGELVFWQAFVGEVYVRLGGDGALPPELLPRLIRHFREAENWRLYPEVPGVLARLREAGVKLLVVSNWDSSLPGLLDDLGLTPSFDGILVSALFGASKPSRTIFDEAVRMAGVAHAEALHVGDSVHDDYEGARAAGLAALLIDRHGRAPTGVDAVSSLEEVVARVLPPRPAADGSSR
ncbi:MAG TPA: HAD family hydrolase [Thermoanaerobaculia bacterium]|nr:HAD family hydrolase [Thermoanaerobaculia bacterium]